MNLSITLDPWQEEFLSTPGDKILCTGRQVGKSVICGIDAGEYAANNKKKVILMIAPTERQAYALFEKTLDYLIHNYRNLIRKGKDRPTKTKINLTNGTKIWCLPTGISGLGIRFLTVHRLYVDEASRIPAEVWTAVTPMMLTTGGNSILLSTPAGKDGYFYDTWMNKDDSFKSYTRFSVNSEQVILNRQICETWHELQKNKALEHLQRERSRMSSLEYAQEYCGEFIDELRQFFPTELIKSCMELKKKAKEEPPSRSSEKRYLGVDVARLGGDETVLFSLTENSGHLTELEMEIYTKCYLTDTIKRILNSDRKHNFTSIYIDDGGLGVGVFDPLLDHPQTKRKVVAINNSSRSLTRDDDRRKRLLKEDLYNNLLYLMESGKIYLKESSETFQSLKSIQAEYTSGKLRIFGNYSHITEALIRAAWGIKSKNLNIYIEYN